MTHLQTTSYVRAVEVDYDGTLADGRVTHDTLAALREAREHGIRVILATGRIIEELRTVFPDVEDHIDVVVAENGAVLLTPDGARELVAPAGDGKNDHSLLELCEIFAAVANAVESIKLHADLRSPRPSAASQRPTAVVEQVRLELIAALQARRHP